MIHTKFMGLNQYVFIIQNYVPICHLGIINIFFCAYILQKRDIYNIKLAIQYLAPNNNRIHFIVQEATYVLWRF